jgi:staphylococcal nuclease domain-containing protein 1
VFLNDESVAALAVQAGWLEVTNSAARSPVGDTLLALQAAALAAKAGRFSGALGVVRPLHSAVDQLAVFEKLRGKPFDAVVHEIRSGSTVRLIADGALEYLPLQIQLSGVQSPGYKRNQATNEFVPEPFAREAKFFLEQAILHRDVIVTLYAGDKQSLYGTIEYAKRDVGLELLKAGLAYYVGWSASRTPLATVYEQEAHKAALLRQRVWSLPDAAQHLPGNGAGASAARDEPAVFEGEVCEIVNGGAVKVLLNGEPTLVTFSSLRAVQPPREGANGAGNNNNKRGGGKAAAPAAAAEDEEASAASSASSSSSSSSSSTSSNQARLQEHVQRQAREFLRRALVGKKVTVRRDYVRASRNDLPEKAFFSVLVGGKNVAVSLVESGLATVVEHSASDDRSGEYDQLLQAETRAKAERRGVWSDKVPAHKLNDLTVQDRDLSEKERVAKRAELKALFDTLTKKGGAVDGVVEWVINPTRFKVLLPKEKTLVLISLAGVRTPRSDADPTTDANALKHAKLVALQRECQIELVGIQDKAGALLANVRVNKADVAVSLLERGLGEAFGRSERERELEAIQKKAQNEKKGMWASYDPAVEERKAAEAAAAAKEATLAEQSMEVTVTEIVDGNCFYVQKIGEGTVQLEKLMAALREERLGDAPPATIKKGELLLGQFSVDDTWYRARVEGLNKEKQTVDVLYVDYGNGETLPRSRIRALPASGRYSTQALAFQAHPAQLAFVSSCELDDADGYGEDAARQLRDLAFGRQFSAAVEAKYDGVLHLTLVDSVTKSSVNASMLRSGLAVLRKRLRAPPAVLAKLEAEQEAARRGRLNRWKYGDVAELDDEPDRR